MRCEVVAVGTELLLGQVVDTNSSWIGEHLAGLGIDSYYQTKVGDNLERIRAVLETAVARSDFVVVCGGRGPCRDRRRYQLLPPGGCAGQRQRRP